MKFDFVIGNPPYQGDQQGSSHYTLPVYDKFLEAGFELADKVLMIHPARCLFEAGQTPKEWNQKMLKDEHFKVLDYQEDAKKVFQNTDIKGGVVISYRDKTKKFKPIKQFNFILYPKLKSIYEKIENDLTSKGNVGYIINVSTKFNLNNLILDYPQYEGRERRLSSNVLSFDCFSDEPKKNDDICIYGVIKNRRTKKYILKKYIDISSENIYKYKVILPKADGNGLFGEIVTNPLVINISTGYTHTFYGIGCFDNKFEAENTLKYTKTKFARTFLSILKVTQNVNADTWAFVPLQDFTDKSDIDWTKPISDIDRQLYKKYNLSQDEIDFIETNVKEMI